MEKNCLGILVTGTRGKSSFVRLLCTLLHRAGYRVWGRSTGSEALSFEEGVWRTLRRHAPASVEEMRWWLGKVSSAAEMVVMENSAVSPELQPLGGLWLNPRGVVWTTLGEDHQEYWGRGKAGALRALLKGIPRGVPVFLGEELSRQEEVLGELRRLRCSWYPPKELPQRWDFPTEHLHMALRLWEVFRLDRPFLKRVPTKSRELNLPLPEGGLAYAFEANDVETTGKRLATLGWDPRECALWFHHRGDRPGRMQAFAPLFGLSWKEKFFTGAYPFRSLQGWRFLGNPRPETILSLLKGNVFGCGNTKGLPWEVLKIAEEKGF